MRKNMLVLAVILVGSVLVLLGFLGYMRIFVPLTFSQTTMGPYTIAYESFTGPYAKTGQVFDKVYKTLGAEGIATTVGLGIYYDDPSKTPQDQLRSDCGVVLQEKDLARVPELQKRFSIKTLAASPAVVTRFPIRNNLSYMLGPIKVYPALTKKLASEKITPTLMYEMYDMPAKQITFVATYQLSQESPAAAEAK
jgi:hypothetical protein